MGRPKRAADGGLVYHVLNRAHAHMTIFEKDEDYEAFERVLEEAVARTETQLLAYCLMPKPLAPGGLAQRRWGAVAIGWLADANSHATLACSPAFRRQWSRVSRAVQFLSGSGRRPL